MKRVLGTGIVVTVVAAATVTTFLFMKSSSAPAAHTQTTPTSSKTTNDSRVEVKLPGTTPIEALKEDYHDPASLWVVVSKEHPLASAEYVPASLSRPNITLNSAKSSEEQSLRSDILTPTEELFAGAKTAGFDVMLASGYRSYALQKSYFDNYARVSGEAEANKFSAHPGQSEHQTGLAFDISLTNRSCYLETCFAETEAAKWFAAHAYEYGFILRYPSDKTDITKYQFEPWHFRYVGKDLARALHDSGLTLDEAFPALEKARDQLLEKKLIPKE